MVMDQGLSGQVASPRLAKAGGGGDFHGLSGRGTCLPYAQFDTTISIYFLLDQGASGREVGKWRVSGFNSDDTDNQWRGYEESASYMSTSLMIGRVFQGC